VIPSRIRRGPSVESNSTLMFRHWQTTGPVVGAVASPRRASVATVIGRQA
jgi:hypothetical protein